MALDPKNDPSKEPSVPSGWSAKFDEKYKTWFYVDLNSKKSQWEAPPGTSFKSNDDIGPPPYGPNSQSGQSAQPNDSRGFSGPAPQGGYAPQPNYGGYPQQGYGGYPQQGYGAYPPQGYGGYPPQGYGGYPQQGYGYQHQQYPVQQKQSRFGGGAGLAMGAGAGLLGGMLIGDAIGDAQMDAYQDGVNDGADMGGGDFDGGDF